jgi:beta-galactosidase
MKKHIFLIVIYCLFIAFGMKAQSKHQFEIKGGEFVLDGNTIKIYSGEMHFARVPKEYWRHRLKMMKAMGLNAVATYVFWNYHEVSPGNWDFKTGNKNIADFIKTAGEEGLMVILRPGPYACAEWEFGGYPWWLQKEQSLVIRSNNKAFLDSSNTYIQQLAKQIKPFLVTNGGPVIMVQAENEFGSYVAQRKDIPLSEHKLYNAKIKQLLIDAGINVPLFTSDGSWLFSGGAIEGVLPTANGEDDVVKLKKIVNEYNKGQGPYMVAEFYPGWLSHWVEPFPNVSVESVVKQSEKYLQNGVSFNYYMIHGGTNFAFTSGANYDANHDIQPDLTSYDYDAPISEAGWVTPKYTALRALFGKYLNTTLPSIPAPISTIAIPSIKLNKTVDAFAVKQKIKTVESDTTLTFEDMNQGYGYMWYTKHFTQPIKGKLLIKGLRDFATIYVNGSKVAELNRYFKNYSCEVDIPFNSTLEILVENMGRINYGAEIVHNLKGILGKVMIDDNEITGGWKMAGMPLENSPDFKNNLSSYAKGRPVFYQGNFNLLQTGDTFLDMSKWGKGIVFVNGHHIGRYWNLGPQQTLYIPGVWLKKGKNEVIVFEQLNDVKHTELQAVKLPVLNKLKQ